VAVGGWGDGCPSELTGASGEVPGGSSLLCEKPVLRKLLRKVTGKGVTVVLPAGPAFGGDITYPARYPELIAVKGACKDQDNWSGFCAPDRTNGSSSSPFLDVVAPSFAVWTAGLRHQGFNSTWSGPICEVQFGESCSPVPGQSQEDQDNNQLWYGPWFSHSGATAHVAGIAALMIDANSDLTHSDVQQILQSTARDLGPKGFDPSSGYGMADAFEAVKAAERWHRR
jgi:subtilisin family serine protease